MQFTDEQIVITGIHETRRWQSHVYKVGDVEIFYTKTFFPVSCFKEIENYQYLPFVDKKEEIEKLAQKYKGGCMEAPYSEDLYGLYFQDEDLALAFCRTEDFDKYALKAGKIL